MRCCLMSGVSGAVLADVALLGTYMHLEQVLLIPLVLSHLW
jgi:TRAP-type C4-dicarboxylate transport system permease large subunit